MKTLTVLAFMLAVIMVPGVVCGAGGPTDTGPGGLGAYKGTGPGGRGAYVPDELLVKYAPQDLEEARGHYRSGYGIETRRSFKSIGVDHVYLPPNIKVEMALNIFRSDPRVEYAEPNYYRYATEVPNDPLFDQQWGLQNIGQEVNSIPGLKGADISAVEAWKSLLTVNPNVVVAVIDSGIDFNHPDLDGNIWTNIYEIADNSIDDDGNGYVDDVRGWDFYNDTNVPQPNDVSGHGTHVAGIIAAQGNDGIGVAGVSWTAQIMSLRFMDGLGIGSTVDAILAMEYANANGADVINASWGGGGYNQALKDIIDVSPALVVCAAGNQTVDNDLTPHYPASYDSENIIAVAATDNTDALAWFSNYGVKTVDVGAPGAYILSCAPGRKTLWDDDFDDGNIDDWSVGGKQKKGKKTTPVSWGVTDNKFYSGVYSLADSPDGNYLDRASSWIMAPVLDLSGQNSTKLDFMVTGISEPLHDVLNVEVSLDGGIWMPTVIKVAGVGYLLGISGDIIPNWVQATVDLSVYDGIEALYLRFIYTSDKTETADGWYIDDVTVTAGSSDPNDAEYVYRSGTSMAAPYVSGIAALLKGQDGTLKAGDLKAMIEDSVDSLDDLDGKTVTGGRVNADEALQQGNSDEDDDQQ